MSNYTIVDTDILIDAGRGINTAIDYLEQIEEQNQIAISAITQMELIVGCRNKAELRSLEKFLTRFHRLNTTETISEKAVELLRKYRLSHGLLIADALIAATAIVWEYSLVSKNQKDYRFIDNLKLLLYPPVT
ncbi:MAG: type II toxin-antitoxin system VapC family toxin [Chloroflexi bacterium]|nr:type II toxin-antitoxin system VapC family toxin [Chloroflexota bacterium]